MYFAEKIIDVNIYSSVSSQDATAICVKFHKSTVSID